MARDLLPEELIQSLLQRAVVLTLQSHGYTSIHPFALNLLMETVEKRTPTDSKSNLQASFHSSVVLRQWQIHNVVQYHHQRT
jgi:hypothetical protein